MSTHTTDTKSVILTSVAAATTALLPLATTFAATLLANANTVHEQRAELLRARAPLDILRIKIEMVEMEARLERANLKSAIALTAIAATATASAPAIDTDADTDAELLGDDTDAYHSVEPNGYDERVAELRAKLRR
jgi:hypothetical protein